MDKQQGLIQIKQIMKQCQITIDDIQDSLRGTKNTHGAPLVTQLLAYLGGVLVFGGICIFVSMQWEQMNSIARVLVTLGTGFVSFIMALCVITDSRFTKLVTPLFIIAALLEVAGLFVFLDEYFTPTGHWETPTMLVFGCVAIQFGFTFLSLKRPVLLFVTMFALTCFMGAFLDYVYVEEELIAVIIGVALLVATFFINRSRFNVIVPVWYFIASVTFLIGLFEWTEKSWAEIIFVLGNLGLIYVSIYDKSRTLLFVSILGLFLYLSYTAYEHFVDSTGWPIALIFMGLLLFGLSALGVKLNKYYIKEQ